MFYIDTTERQTEGELALVELKMQKALRRQQKIQDAKNARTILNQIQTEEDILEVEIKMEIARIKRESLEAANTLANKLGLDYLP